MAELTEIDSKTFMNCVRNYKVIYDKSLKDFKVPSKKNNAWREISATLGMDMEDAKRKYNSIRTNFSKYLKRVRSTGSGSGRSDLLEIKEEFEYLRWLLVHIKHRKSTTNFKRKQTPDIISNSNSFISSPSTGTMVDADQEMDGDDEEGIESESLCSEEARRTATATSHIEIDKAIDDVSSPDLSLEERIGENQNVPGAKQGDGTPECEPPKGKKRPWSKEVNPPATNEMDREFLKALKSLKKSIEQPEKEKKQDEMDDDYHFCLSLVGPLKNLEPRFKSMAKFQIMKIFNDIEWAGASAAAFASPTSLNNYNEMAYQNHGKSVQSHQYNMQKVQRQPMAPVHGNQKDECLGSDFDK